MLVGAIGAYSLTTAAQGLRALVAFPAVGALAVLAAALLRGWPGLVPWALGSCLAAYAAALLAGGGEGVDPLAPLVAAVLLLAAELGYWSLEARAVWETGAEALRRLGPVLVLALGTAGLGSIVLAASLIRPGGGPLVLALGVGAAVAALALLARLAYTPGR